jgi:solute carrier family 25 S-adenosylmethionine transporter 26
VCGSIAGVISAAITTPIDVCKTRLMLGADAQGLPYVHVGDTFKRIFAEGGVTALFSGFGPRLALTFMGGLIFFGVYEQALELVRTREPLEEEVTADSMHS